MTASRLTMLVHPNVNRSESSTQRSMRIVLEDTSGQVNVPSTSSNRGWVKMRWRLTHLLSPTRSNITNVQEKAPTKKRQMLVHVIRIFAFISLLGVTVAGYIISIKRLSNISTSPPNSDTADDPNHDNSDPVSQSAPLFIHVLFIAALLVEAFGLSRSIRSLVRSILYDPNVPESPWVVLSPIQTSPPAHSSRRTSRIVQAIFGSPPPLPPQPSLPTYDSALQQSARQAARREAALANIPNWTNGRRGREIIGTGDVEDLELERVKRLGGSPPTYRSEEMKKGELVQRSEPPPGRKWRDSHLTAATEVEDEPETPPSTMSTLFDIVRRFSLARTTSPSTKASKPRSSARVTEVEKGVETGVIV